MANETIISVNQVSRRFGKRYAVQDISFSVNRGEIIGFLGPNGAGKSTTMNMICGVMASSSGNITIAGHNIVDTPAQAKQYIGYLPERPPLYLDQTVDAYLDFCARLHQVPANNLVSAISGVKQRCGLSEVGHRLIGNLSRGYQQRTGIAQAIVHSPVVVILDEATAGLDPNQIVEIRTLIKELGQDHSVILSTHILSEVQGICDRVMIMHNGKLVLDTAAASIDNLEQTFIRLTATAQMPDQQPGFPFVKGGPDSGPM